ncbi:hypothetical protein [Prosthecobacter sp.]|uniref:hypothetical protein n=1 Tax=Prosthecobacter sp. TaxID=1965333 RepID=UPI0037852FCE
MMTTTTMTMIMNTCACSLIALLGAAILALGLRAWRNHREIRRLQRNGSRRLAFRRNWQRGCADEDFLRAMAELCLIILLLASVVSWLALHSPGH